MTGTVELYFRDSHRHDEARVVDWIRLTSGFIGVCQVNFRLPAEHLRADALRVALRNGGIDRQKSGAVIPVIAVS